LDSRFGSAEHQRPQSTLRILIPSEVATIPAVTPETLLLKPILLIDERYRDSVSSVLFFLSTITALSAKSSLE
jgi:hypothetical protein